MVSTVLDQQVSGFAPKERGLSSSSLGRSYNFDMNMSTKLGRNFHDQFSNSKKSSAFDAQNTHGFLGSQTYNRPLDPLRHHLQNQKYHQESRSYSNEQIKGMASQNANKSPLSQYFGQTHGDRDASEQLFNYRDLSKEAIQRQRAAIQGTDRITSYPTNITNMTPDQIPVSPDVGSQAYKGSTGLEPTVSHFTNEFSASGFTWRQEKL